MFVESIPLEDFLSYFTECLINHFGHDGYEIDEGGRGTITFISPCEEFPEGVIELEHSDNIIETVDYSHEL
ncbi:hypothetical protein Thpro_022061 [Acidihalobacter prosperus]|uniref:Uncharacterized protein n=1 Tax=Acidihalobacter prosperus TaxID=160660 RepID=A0A1A6C313_9GAMM|nr:hypothetical protein Thpro_022061 [Acidihalobacter prosperus]